MEGPRFLVSLTDIIALNESIKANLENVGNTLHSRFDALAGQLGVQGSSSRGPGIVAKRDENSSGSEYNSYNTSRRSSGDHDHFVQLSTAVFQPRSCGLSCSCSCHYGSTFRTPQWLSMAIGDLSFAFFGIPRWTYKSCNDNICSHRGRRLVRTSYYFPAWCLNRMVSVVDSWGPFGVHTTVLKTAPVIPSTSNIFAFSQQGHVEGLKVLFRQGLASPFDISGADGRSALNVCQPHPLLM